MLHKAGARAQPVGLAQLKIDFAGDALDPAGTGSALQRGISGPVATPGPWSHLRSHVAQVHVGSWSWQDWVMVARRRKCLSSQGPLRSL